MLAVLIIVGIKLSNKNFEQLLPEYRKRYYDSVQQMIKGGILAYEDENEQANTPRKIKYSCTPEQVASNLCWSNDVYRKSQLWEDIENHNKQTAITDQEKYFLNHKVKNCSSRNVDNRSCIALKAVNKNAHYKPEHFFKSPSPWSGTLRFRTESEGMSLVSNSLFSILTVNSSWASAGNYFSYQIADTNNVRRVEKALNVQGRENRQSARITYKEQRLQIEQVGTATDPNNTFFVSFYRPSEGNIFTLNKTLTAADLYESDILNFRLNSNPGKTFYITKTIDADVISFENVTPNYKQGVLSPTRIAIDDSDSSLMLPVTDALDALFQNKSFSNLNPFDLSLTIDRNLQNETLGILKEFGRPLTNLKRASITVLDAKTGDILAIPSWKDPTKSENDQINQNFLNHAIGSVFKIFLTTAILNKVPSYKDRTIPCAMADKRETFWGIQFTSLPPAHTIPGCNKNGTYGLKEFIKYSSNPFMFDLGVRALAIHDQDQFEKLKRDQASPPLKLPLSKSKMFLAAKSNQNGNEYQPDFVYHWKQENNTLINMGEHWMINELEKIFNVSARFPDNGLARYDHSIFNAFKKKLFKDNLDPNTMAEIDEFFSSSFHLITPEMTALNINMFTNIDGDYRSFLLGGGSSRWTNVKVAEAFSRIVTGKDVRANIFHEIKFKNSGEEPIINNSTEQAIDNLDTEVRKSMLSAMEGPSTSGGTAQAMGIAFDDIMRVRGDKEYFKLYSKTGTPSRPVINGKDTNSAFYVFSLVKVTNTGDFEDGVTVAVYIEDQGESKLAVKLATKLIEPLLKYKGWDKPHPHMESRGDSSSKPPTLPRGRTHVSRKIRATHHH